ncbi:glycosyltransferase family 39 protein [Candidatus Roizmanbacteria bacterium]|nr:glycosyltransferase family 39 protein [Candidatus Roizmanbacteria bacterium]
MKKKEILLIFLILVGVFIVRLYRFNNPIADWHSWRQADTSAVSRNFVKDGFDLLHPRMDNISNVQSGKDNPQGYFFVEFPLYNAAQAGLFKFFGVLTLEEWGRVISIISSCLITLFLYLIVRRHSNQTIGLLSAFFYAFTPYNIYYGRTILTDTSMVMATLGAIYFFDRYLDVIARSESRLNREKTTKQSQTGSILFYLLALVFTAGALLLKAHALFFVLPIVYLAWKKFGFKLFFQWQLWFFAIVAIAPLAAWRNWMTQFPEGIPASNWLFNGNGIRFRPSFFRWIFYERLTILISGYFGVVLALIGIYRMKKLKEWLFFVAFFLSSLIYVCVVATGNVQHDYYQIPIMPSVAILFAIGTYFLSQWSLSKVPVGKILVVVCILLGFYFSWQHVKDFFNINNKSIIVAGEAVDRLTPKDAKVIANYNGDSSFLYQTKRKGWASFEASLPEMVKKGASYLVLVNPTKEDQGLSKEYKIVSETQDYILFDLKNK